MRDPILRTEIKIFEGCQSQLHALFKYQHPDRNALAGISVDDTELCKQEHLNCLVERLLPPTLKSGPHPRSPVRTIRWAQLQEVEELFLDWRPAAYDESTRAILMNPEVYAQCPSPGCAHVVFARHVMAEYIGSIIVEDRTRNRSIMFRNSIVLAKQVFRRFRNCAERLPPFSDASRLSRSFQQTIKRQPLTFEQVFADFIESAVAGITGFTVRDEKILRVDELGSQRVSGALAYLRALPHD